MFLYRYKPFEYVNFVLINLFFKKNEEKLCYFVISPVNETPCKWFSIYYAPFSVSADDSSFYIKNMNVPTQKYHL